MEALDDEKEQSVVKPRNAFIAFLLSLIIPGLGQVYNGQLKKGVSIFTAVLVGPIIWGLNQWPAFFFGMMILFILEIGLRIFSIVDAIIHAKRQKEYELKSYNKWYYHLLIAAGVFVIFLFYDMASVLGVQTFKIPTTSNEPTIQFGDYVVVDLNFYERRDIDYGDLVVFEKSDKEIWSYRVVGLPNDRLELVNNVLTINGKPNKSILIGETIFEKIPVIEFEVEQPNGHTHRIYTNKIPYDATKANMLNIVVPPNSYYLLGDNRDNAFDSRYNGPVRKENILGRFIYSYWGKSTDRINIDFTEQ